MLKGKTVLLGVTGDIAYYKSAGLASALVKQGANVRVLMTRNATEFIGPHTFESLTGSRVSVDTSDRNYQFRVKHIALAGQADLVLVAPATANVLTKLVHGLANDMLATTVLACNCPKIAASTMNTRTYKNPVTQDNLALLWRYGWEIVESTSGRLAYEAVGKGKMSELGELLETVLHTLSHAKDMGGLKVLVIAGPTQEILDPVHCLTNHSIGWMGYVVARAVAAHGTKVALVSGPMALERSACVGTVGVVSAQDIFEVAIARASGQDIIIKVAAVADYRPVQAAQDKVKKGERGLSVPPKRTRDVLTWLGEYREPRWFLCGLSMRIRGMVEDSRRKLEKKHLDLITANNLEESGTGFAVPTNLLTLTSPRGELELPLLTEEEATHRLPDEVLKPR